MSTKQANHKVMRRMGKNLPDNFRKITFYSFVFEDDIDTIGNTEVPSNRKIMVLERVYESSNFNQQSLNAFINCLIQLARDGQYNVETLGQYQVVSNRNDSGLFLLKNLIEESIHNYFMDINRKKVVRLTESDLHNIIKESVREILWESVNDKEIWTLRVNTDTN